MPYRVWYGRRDRRDHGADSGHRDAASGRHHRENVLVSNRPTASDLIVVNRRLDSFPLPDMQRVAGDLVVKAHKPVLAVPDNANGFTVTGTALVAWDGSHAAAAALRAAVPLLQMASKVVLLQLEEPGNTALVDDAATYLSRHRISAVIRRETPEGSIGETLLAEAASGRYAYVVMGGFGHHRFVERLFGGVTRAMLSHAPIPLLMAH